MAGLRAVAPGERRRRRKVPATLLKAVEEGDGTDILEVLRRRLAEAMDDPNIRGADLAALSRRLLEIGRELEQTDPDEGEAEPTPDEVFDPGAL